MARQESGGGCCNKLCIGMAVAMWANIGAQYRALQQGGRLYPGLAQTACPKNMDRDTESSGFLGPDLAGLWARGWCRRSPAHAKE